LTKEKNVVITNLENIFFLYIYKKYVLFFRKRLELQLKNTYFHLQIHKSHLSDKKVNEKSSVQMCSAYKISLSKRAMTVTSATADPVNAVGLMSIYSFFIVRTGQISSHTVTLHHLRLGIITFIPTG